MLPVLRPGDVDPAAGFESPPPRRASEILPPELFRGPHHRVLDAVGSDGFFHLFRIESEFGSFEAAGDLALRDRVQEIRALATLRAVEKSPAFAAARQAARSEPCVARWRLLDETDPDPGGVPAEARHEILRIDALPPAARSPEEAQARDAVLAFETAQRRLARRLGVSPYSANRTLLAALHPAAWAISAGDLPLDAVPDLRGTSVAVLPEDVVPGARLETLFQQDSPEDLRRLSRLELAVMGVSAPVAEEFLDHPAWTPRLATALVESLVALDPARERASIVERALEARSEADALFFVMAALVLRAHHAEAAPLERVMALGERAVAGIAADGTLLVPAPVDELFWTRPALRFAENVAAATPAGVTIRTREVHATGRVSPRARRELETRQIGVREAVSREVFERLAASAPAATTEGALAPSQPPAPAPTPLRQAAPSGEGTACCQVGPD
jgi:hypothetical protein